jgi:hypothetical protein
MPFKIRKWSELPQRSKVYLCITAVCIAFVLLDRLFQRQQSHSHIHSPGLLG